jgi:8-oxo-dGTP pyrophosphatase MutT (NUDIX family)
MLLRDGADGLEVYLARRSRESRFMPGAYVFPGGAVDRSDAEPEVLSHTLGLETLTSVAPAFAVAALRETFEEAGVLLAAGTDGSVRRFESSVLADLRAGLSKGARLADLVHAHDAVLDARGLAHYSNWVTPEGEPLRFDTHFFAARAPEEQTASHDAFELYDGRWMTARSALDAAARGELAIMFPTLRHLERIAAYSDVDAFLAHARSRSVVPVAPALLGSGGIDLRADPDAW